MTPKPGRDPRPRALGVRSSSIACALAWSVVTASTATSTQAPVTLDHVLTLSARYVADYQVRLSSVVAEERYEQRVESRNSGGFGPFGGATGSRTESRRRRLVSDYLLVRARGQSGWVPFRDVYEVDGKAVRDRDERLTKLFLESEASAWDQAAVIADESSRFNIGDVHRTVNVPTLALMLLSDEYRAGFEFRKEDTRRSNTTETWMVSYREQRRPTLIRGLDGVDLPVSGSFLIDPNDGRIHETVVRTDDGNLRSSIEVRYELDGELGLWVPVEMKEEYRTSEGETIEGTATYGRFRRFNVQTSEQIR